MSQQNGPLGLELCIRQFEFRYECHVNVRMGLVVNAWGEMQGTCIYEVYSAWPLLTGVMGVHLSLIKESFLAL